MTFRKGLEWVSENWEHLSPDSLKTLLSVKDKRELELVTAFAPFSAPDGLLNAKEKRKSEDESPRVKPRKSKRLLRTAEFYKTETTNGTEYFRLVKKKARDNWSISWLYGENDVLELQQPELENRKEIMPGCFLTSSHFQHEFNPKNSEECEDITVVGHIDIDKNKITFEERYTQCLDMLERVLSRGVDGNAEEWARFVWQAHPTVDQFEFKEILMQKGEVCDVCNMKRNVSFEFDVGGGHTFLAGSECAKVVISASEVVKHFNSRAEYDEAMQNLLELVTEE